MLRIYVKTLGCKVNAIESEHILDELGDFPIEQVIDEDHAEVALINSCSVTAEADAKTRKAIRKLCKNPLIRDVVVTGCSAAMHPELADIDQKVRIVTDKSRVFEEIAAFHALEKNEVEKETHSLGSDGLSKRLSPRARSFVKIQEGCENFCSYCIVPFARGKSTSLGYDEIKDQIAEQLKQGMHEVVLSGINIGNYRDKKYSIDNLQTLIKRLLHELDIHRLRISSIEPVDCTEDFLQYFASEDRICKHIHLPLQSGSSDILCAMERAYTADEFLRLVKRIYELVPDCAITSDVIVGFPGETNDDFAQTQTVCTEAQFSQLHVFKYSVRAGTKAAKLADQVDSQVASERSQILRELSAQLHKNYRQKFLGQEIEIVIESSDGHRVRGVSEHYLRYEAIPHSIRINDKVYSLDKDSSLNEELMQVGAIATILG